MNRENIRKRQKQLLQILTKDKNLHLDIDPFILNYSKTSLYTKRKKSMIRIWPCLKEIWNEEIEYLFLAYCRKTTLPKYLTHLSDGYLFIQNLRNQKVMFTSRIIWDYCLIDLKYSMTTFGLSENKTNFKFKLMKDRKRIFIGIKINKFLRVLKFIFPF